MSSGQSREHSLPMHGHKSHNGADFFLCQREGQTVLFYVMRKIYAPSWFKTTLILGGPAVEFPANIFEY